MTGFQQGPKAWYHVLASMSAPRWRRYIKALVDWLARLIAAIVAALIVAMLKGWREGRLA